MCVEVYPLGHEPNSTAHSSECRRTHDFGNLVAKPHVAPSPSSSRPNRSPGGRGCDQSGYRRRRGPVASDRPTVARAFSRLASGRPGERCVASRSQTPHLAPEDSGGHRGHAPYQAPQCHPLEHAEYGPGAASVRDQHSPHLARPQPQAPLGRDVQTQPGQTICRETDRRRRPVPESSGEGPGPVRR